MIVENGENEDTYSNILEVVNKLHHYNPKYSDKFTTHQVCEKIKELGIEQIDYSNDYKGTEKFCGWLVTPEILDQIEKGENNETKN